MRTIKFRGKDYETGEWVQGQFFQRLGHYPAIIEPRPHNGKVKYFETAVRDDTVGQFTGLYDKNGKEIYEGDIIRTYVTIKDFEEEIEEQFWRVGVIRFTRGQFALTECRNYADKDMKTPHRWSPNKRALCTYPSYRSEVIGNIHDNPELLKGDKR